MAYRADIEIAVRGAQELKRLQNEISATSKLVTSLNNYLENIGGSGVVRSISNLQDTVQKAANAFNTAALNTEEATIAARKYISATADLNAGLREKQTLLKSINEEERKARLTAIGREVGGRPAGGYAGPIGPGAASPIGALVGQQSPVAERIQRTIRGRQDEIDLKQALLRLEQKSAEELNRKVQSQEALVQGTREVLALVEQQNRRQQFLAGKSGTAVQGPLAGPRAMGFPVALSLSAAEQKGLQTEAQKQQILQRMVATRQQLVGLATNLQRLDQNAVVAIADAERAQNSLNAAKARGLEIARQDAVIRAKEGAASVAARQRLSAEAANRQLMQNAGFGVQGPALPPAAVSSRGQGIGGRLGGAFSGSIIGGAFPLLFGQGGGAAAGGAIGGLVGGLAGPGGSFAGSLLGTLLGDIASRGQAVKQLGEDLGFSAAQAKTLTDAFKTANTDVEKFTAVIQNIRGVGLELEEQATAVQLVTALTEKYGGSFEKVGNAVTSALESGKVSQAVLNQLTSQGITVQDALATKYDVSRDKILEMAKKGEISVQSLLDTLVELGNASTTAAEKTQTPFEKALSTTGQLFQSFWKDVQTIFAGVSSNGVEAGTALLNIFNKLLQEVLFPLGRFLARIAALFVDVVSTGVRAAAELINGFRGVASAIGDALMGIVNMIPGLRTIVGLARQLLKGATGSKSSDWNDMPWPEGIPKPGSPGMIGQITAPSQALPSGGNKGAKGPKPPEDRTAQLREDLNAMRLISITEDGIRDALFEGNKALAVRLEYEQKVYDINRDTAKAIMNANYESEKAVYRAQKIVRLKDAQLVLEDQLRALVREQAEALDAPDPLRTLQQEIDLIAAKIQGTEEEYIRQLAINELVAKKVPLNDAIAQIDAKTQLNTLLQQQVQLEQLIGTVGQGMGDALTNVFDALINRAEDFNEVLRNTLAGLGRFLMMAGLNILADAGDPSGQGTGILSFLGFGKGFGKRAAGGPVTGNAPYLVGERGPELFVPNTGGSVVPTNDLRAAMGSAPGSAGAPVLNMSFQTTNIGGVEYVSRDQLEAAMAATRRQATSDGAKRGMSMTLDKLQQSPGTRGRVGLR